MMNIAQVLLALCVVLFAGSNNSLDKKKATAQQDNIEAGHSDTVLRTGWYYVVDTNSGYQRYYQDRLNRVTEPYFLNPEPIVKAENIRKLEVSEGGSAGQMDYGLVMWFDEEGTERWSIATKNSIKRRLGFILDNRLIQVSMVQSQITGGVSIVRNTYSQQELEEFKAAIENGK